MDKKEVIAETFQKHFNHHGFKKTSVDDIAKELQISKKTIYKYFSTKEKIFYYIISKVAKKFSSDMEKKIQVYESNKDKLENLILLIFSETKKWLKKGNDAFEFKYKYEISEIAFKDAYNELIKKIIDDGVNNNEFKIENNEIVVSFINGIFSESMKLISVNPELDVEKQVVSSIFKLLQ